jgi:hypothetical protein
MNKSRTTFDGREAWLTGLIQAFLLASEGMALRAIAAHLTNEGIVLPSGRPVTVATLWRHLTDPGYAGLSASKRTFRVVEPIVSEKLFETVQTALRERCRSNTALAPSSAVNSDQEHQKGRKAASFLAS